MWVFQALGLFANVAIGGSIEVGRPIENALHQIAATFWTATHQIQAEASANAWGSFTCRLTCRVYGFADSSVFIDKRTTTMAARGLLLVRSSILDLLEADDERDAQPDWSPRDENSR